MCVCVVGISHFVTTYVVAGIRLDHKSCEVLEAVLSRMQMTTLDLERTNLDDEVTNSSNFVSYDYPSPSLYRELLHFVRWWSFTVVHHV